MILYLAGLKAVDPSLREAAAIDGASEWHAFRTVVFPALQPINIVIVVDHGDRGAARVRHRLHHQPRPERARAALGARHRQHHRRGEPHRLRLGDRGGPAHDLDRPDRHLRLEHASRRPRRDERDRRPPTRGARREAPRREARCARASALHVVPDRDRAALARAGRCGRSSPSFRPYADTAEHGYVSLAAAPQPRQLPQRLDAGARSRSTSGTR